jgi:hypothetical protein
MLALTLALGVVIVMIIRREPKKPPKDDKHRTRRVQRRYWTLAALGVLLGTTLIQTPMLGTPVRGVVNKTADVLTSREAPRIQVPQLVPDQARPGKDQARKGG